MNLSEDGDPTVFILTRFPGVYLLLQVAHSPLTCLLPWFHFFSSWPKPGRRGSAHSSACTWHLEADTLLNWSFSACGAGNHPAAVTRRTCSALHLLLAKVLTHVGSPAQSVPPCLSWVSWPAPTGILDIGCFTVPSASLRAFSSFQPPWVSLAPSPASRRISGLTGTS